MMKTTTMMMMMTQRQKEYLQILEDAQSVQKRRVLMLSSLELVLGHGQNCAVLHFLLLVVVVSRRHLGLDLHFCLMLHHEKQLMLLQLPC